MMRWWRRWRATRSLYVAVRALDWDQAVAQIRAGARVDGLFPVPGKQPDKPDAQVPWLVLACQLRSPALLEAGLAAGAPLDAVGPDPLAAPALLEAWRQGRWDMALDLIGAGADLKTPVRVLDASRDLGDHLRLRPHATTVLDTCLQDLLEGKARCLRLEYLAQEITSGRCVWSQLPQVQAQRAAVEARRLATGLPQGVDGSARLRF